MSCYPTIVSSGNVVVNHFPMKMILSANLSKIHCLEISQPNISLTCPQFSKFWVCLLYSPFPPSHKYFTVWKSQYINNSLMNRSSMSNSFLMSKSVLNIYLFSAESGQASYRKVACFTKKSWNDINMCHKFTIVYAHLMTKAELQFSLHALFHKTVLSSFHYSQ